MEPKVPKMTRYRRTCARVESSMIGVALSSMAQPSSYSGAIETLAVLMLRPIDSQIEVLDDAVRPFVDVVVVAGYGRVCVGKPCS